MLAKQDIGRQLIRGVFWVSLSLPAGTSEGYNAGTARTAPAKHPEVNNKKG